MNEKASKALAELEKSINSAEYLAGAPYWETKLRWDIKGKLMYASGQLETLKKALEEQAQEHKP